MIRIRSYAALTILSVALVGQLRGQTREQVAVDALASPQVSAPSVANYAADSLTTRTTGARTILGPGDLIEISVFNVPELTQRVRVSDDGAIALALIGQIKASGLTPEALRGMVTADLVRGEFVRNPQVNLFIAEYAGQMAYVVGEVQRPGAYPLLRSHRLRDLLAVAGGLNQRASNDVTVTRAGTNPVVLHVNAAVDDDANNPEIYPGDKLSVSQSGIVYVLGDVGKPGAFILNRNSQVTIMQALALAEGIQASASIKKATLLRASEDGRQEVPINIKKILKLESPDIPVRTGDILYVYSSLTRGLGRSAIQSVLATASSAAIYVEAGR